MNFIGIDPGSSGGFAVLSSDGTITTTPCHDTESAVWKFFDDLPDNMTAIIEQVGGYVSGDYDLPGMGASMFAFGKNYGMLRAFLVAAAIPFVAVVPQTWMKEFGMKRKPKESKVAFKTRLRDEAARVFPGTKPTKVVCDAMLLAEFAHRKYPRGL